LVDWYLGTVGFSYKEWAGVFYPAGMASRSYLAHYSQIFNAVELDSTFYGTPPADRVRQWASLVPEAFKFCAKTPRQITHDLGLIKAQAPMATFVETMGLLGDKLGAILIQLPPQFSVAQLETVTSFLEDLPAGVQYALEFRHPSWFTAETAALLKAYQVCWVSTEYLNLPDQVEVTSDVLYIRWLGRHGRFEQKNREQIDVTPRLQWWWEQLQPHLEQVQTVYGFFNNDFAGYSPATCNRFKTLIGLPVAASQAPQQGTLF
jgi:uncharacterized protein YecE (DUF72 family)